MSENAGEREAVEVWLADVHAFWAAHASALEQLLSDDELDRAARFRFERDRQRFAARRALLRVVLARACGEDPKALRFAYGPQGKPRLEGTDLEFSASHSDGVAAFAIARAAEVGVDVERIREDVDVDGLAHRFFAPAEAEALARLEPPERRSAFFAVWTAKEAFVKAIGRGLSYPLDAFVVSLGERPAIEVDGDPGESARWALHIFDAGPDHAGALVVAGAARFGPPQMLDPGVPFD